MNLIRIIRAPFLTATVAPGLVGAALAWSEGELNLGYLLLTVIGIACVNAGVNTANDYFDHISGNDEGNQELTPFSGGSRVIQEGMVSARQVLTISLLFFAMGSAIGLVLVLTRGWPVFWFGLLGVFIGFFSSAPPFRLNYVGHGLGELAAGIGCGPLIVMGSYYVQAQRLSWEAFGVSVIVGCFEAAVLFVNEFPDYEADKAVGKDTLVVVMGKERAVWGYLALLAAAYATLIFGIAIGLFPLPLLLVLLTLPLAVKGIQGVFRHHNDTAKLVPTNALTIQLNLVTSVLLCVGFVIAGILT